MSDIVPGGSNDTDEHRPPLPASTAGPKKSKRGRPRKHPLPQNTARPVRETVHRRTSREQKALMQDLGPQMWPQSPQPSASRDSLTSDASTSSDYSRGSTTPATTMAPFIEHKMNSSARHMRNLAEKMRRDKLNTYVSELAAIVPPVADSSKKVDKTSVLRLAANFIRMHNMLGGDVATEPILPEGLPGEAASGLMETLGNKFLLVTTNSGKIVFVSDAIEQTLGHGQMELLGCSLYSFVHPDDCDLLRTQLTPRDTTRRSFFCRFAEKSLSRNETRSYEIIHVQGRLRIVPPTPDITLIKREKEEGAALPTEDTFPPVRHRRSTRHYGSLHISEDSSGSEECEEGRVPQSRDTHLLVALVRLIKERPLTELSRVESMRDEYITRHDANGTIMYTDHRISYVTGYMPENVRGSSAFMYIHQNDLLWSLVAQKQMFCTKENRKGVVSYRLRCRDNSYITLHSRGYLELNKQTKEIESFVCINTVVDEHQSEKEIRQQRRQLLPIIAGASTDDLIANLSSEFPVEIMQILHNTLGQKKIQMMLSAAANMEKKAATRHGVQRTATITEITEDSCSTSAKGRSPRKIAGEIKSPKLKPANEKSLGIKSENKMWVTLNEEQSSKPNGRAQKRSHAEETVEGKHGMSARERATRNSESSSDSGMMSPNELTDYSPGKGCGNEPYRCIKKLRYDRLDDPNTPEASTSWTNDSSTFFPSEPSMVFEEVHPSRQSLLESDARRKKQMFQMEKMAYSMNQIHDRKREPNTFPALDIPEEVSHEHNVQYKKQEQLSPQPNSRASKNFNLKPLPYSLYSPLHHLERKEVNQNEQQNDVLTTDENSQTASPERPLSGLHRHASPSNNSLHPTSNHHVPQLPSSTTSISHPCPISPSMAANSTSSQSNSLHAGSPNFLSPQSRDNSTQPTQTILETSVEDSSVANSLQCLDASLAELVDRMGGSPNPQEGNCSATSNESTTRLCNSQQSYSYDKSASTDTQMDAQNAQVSQIYPCTPSITVSPSGERPQSLSPVWGDGYLPGACKQQWTQSDHRKGEHFKAGEKAEGQEEMMQGPILKQQTSLTEPNESMTSQQRQELMLQQQRDQSQVQESLQPQQYCRQGGYRQNL